MSEHHILKYTEDGNKILIIAFAGLGQMLNMPHFEFKNFLTSNFSSIDFIFVKDPTRSWYSRDIPGLGKGVDEISKTLNSIVKDLNPDKLITIGTSAGGYGAILFGHLLNADDSISFNPQTVLVKEIPHQGHPRKMEVMHDLDPKYKELNNLNYKDSYKIHIVYGTNEKEDILMAERMSHLKNTVLYPYPFKHSIAGPLRDNGELYKIFNNIINNER